MSIVNYFCGLPPKIKICHLSTVHFALDTRIFYRMCRSLSEEYEVHLLAVHPQNELREGVHIHAFRRFHSRKRRIAIGWLLAFFRAIAINARIYHLHDPELIPCGLLLRLLGKKVILDIHENIAEDIFDKPWIRNQQRIYRVFHFFERLACKYFYIILAETSYERRYKKLAKQCVTVLNFCETDFFKPFVKTSGRKGLNLFYIGIVLENRGILQIIDAMRALQLEGYNPHFHCVGELYSDLERKILALSYYPEIEPNLHFHGRMPLEQGYAMSMDMDIGLCIIWPMSNSIESYPTKLFEYMSVGLPIVCSGFELYRQVVEGHHCGTCVDPMDSLDLKNAIKAIHTDVEKSELMSKSGPPAVLENYNWESQKPVLSGVYRELSNNLNKKR